MHPALALIVFGAIAGYQYGKRTGKPWLWVAISVPTSVVAYVLLMAAVG